MGTIDYCLGSSVILADFMDAAKCVWNLGFCSGINYLNALQDLIYLGSSVVHPLTLCTISQLVKLYSKEHRNVCENKGIYRGQMILDIDNLESAGCWAVMEELQSVILFHIQRYKTF